MTRIRAEDYEDKKRLILRKAAALVARVRDQPRVDAAGARAQAVRAATQLSAIGTSSARSIRLRATTFSASVSSAPSKIDSTRASTKYRLTALSSA